MLQKKEKGTESEEADAMRARRLIDE